jgi:hypothetical protein
VYYPIEGQPDLNKVVVLPPLIPESIHAFTKYSKAIRDELDIYVNKCLAETV